MNAKKKPDKSNASIAENRKARFDYFIDETYEAGLALQGWEVKSLRAGRAQLKESYAFIKNGEAFLYGAHISALPTASTHFVPDPVRTRKLLLNRAELNRLQIAVDRKGYTLAPLELYWKNGRANASTMSVSAVSRTISSSQLWMRRRRTDLYGTRCTNISDGKRTTCFFSR